MPCDYSLSCAAMYTSQLALEAASLEWAVKLELGRSPTSLIQALSSVFRVTTLGGHREFLMQAGEGKICPGNIGMKRVKNLRMKTKLLRPPSS